MSSSSNDTGVTDLAVHVVRSAGGSILSGSIDLDLNYQFANDETVVGINIATGAGTVSLNTDISAGSAIMATAGSGRVQRQIQVAAADSAALAALNGLISTPGNYSVNVLTTGQQKPALNGAMVAAKTAVLMAPLSSSQGAGVATVTILFTGTPYNLTSAEVGWQIGYQLSGQATFSSARIYAGPGGSGTIAVAADLIPGTQGAANGTGTLTVPATEIDTTNTLLVNSIRGILTAPTSYSVGVATVENPAAPLVGQLRGTDSVTLQISNPKESGSAWAIYIHTLRQSSGAVQAGTIIFDLNYREPAGAQFTALNIDGEIPGPSVALNASGAGNLYSVVEVFQGPALATLGDIVSRPDKHAINAQSTAGGSYSLPLAALDSSLPAVAAVIPIVEVKNLSTFAPGELVEIYGTSLAKVTTDLSGWPGISLPISLNGVSVTVGGQTARILYVSPYQVDAELPFETPTGTQSLVLTTANGSSASVPLNVVTVAPALYGFGFENSNFSIVSAANPSKAGDVLVFYCSGMGHTSPALTTGQITPAGPPFYNTATPTVSIGGTAATVLYSIAAPPYVTGLYQMAVKVPSGLVKGGVPVVATVGGVQSNTVEIQVQ